VSYTIPTSGRAFDVTGLGNALVDALVRVEQDTVVDQMNLTRGHMHPVDHTAWQAAYDQLEGFGVELQSGGSCANTIAAMGLMGARSLYCGQVGDDALGKLYRDRLQEACGANAIQVSADMPTGKCLSIISGADAERTMLSDLGASVHLPALGDFAAQIERSRLLHLTGYLLLGDPMRARALEAIAVAKAAGVPVSLDVADPFVVDTVGELMWQVIEESVDIVFLNEQEAATLCGSTPEAAFERLSAVVDTTVVKLGSRGSMVSHRGEVVRAGIHRVDAIDTTGAGDAYAAGFLFGLLNDWGPAQSADLGSRVAAMAVSQVGAVVRDRDVLAEACRAARLGA
jgi:hypothetical protein